jgi:hypothetical protein
MAKKATAKAADTVASNHPAKGSRWSDGKQEHVVSTIAVDHEDRAVVVYTGNDGQTRTCPVGDFYKRVGKKAVT